MGSIVEWAVGNLGQTGRVTVNVVFFEGKSARRHCEEECASLSTVCKRLHRAYPILREIIEDELDDPDDEIRAEFEALFGLGARHSK